MPADHVIPDEQKFLRAVALGVQVAQAGKLVTFGIKPTRPETGYGYIKAAGRRPLLAQGGLKALAVARFVEKPDLPTAKRYLRAGGRSEEHTSELQSPCNLVCRLLLEKKKKKQMHSLTTTRAQPAVAL